MEVGVISQVFVSLALQLNLLVCPWQLLGFLDVNVEGSKPNILYTVLAVCQEKKQELLPAHLTYLRLCTLLQTGHHNRVMFACRILCCSTLLWHNALHAADRD